MNVPGINEDTATKTRRKVQEPPKYQVVLHNDHYTTMEFVVEVLKTIFRKSSIESHAIMMAVHKKGRGVVGLYSYDIAASKVEQTKRLARRHGYPLKCTLEEV
jgi:ATP-dependent Clp protease adaptor protein ClpS